MVDDKSKLSGDAMDAFTAAQPVISNLRLFSDELLEKFHGKICEFYIGDQAEVIAFDESTVPQNCTIIGKLVAVLDRFLILDCCYVDKAGKIRSGNFVYLNTFQVRAMSELDGSGCLNDVFLSCKNAEKIRKSILTHHTK